jgi:hypothetical protein
MKRLVLAAIGMYQRNVSPGRPPACRFEPTCSHYGHEAIERHGLMKGVWLAGKRLLRCNPLSRGGYDPVP